MTDRSKKEKEVLSKEADKRKALMYNDLLSEGAQKDLVARILHDVKDSEGARTEYFARRKEIIDIYEGKTKEKVDPFPGCANVNTMITAMVVELLQAKLFPTVYNEDLIYFRPVESGDVETAEAVSVFMRWAQREAKMASVVDDVIKALCLEGTAVVKVRWDEEYRWVQRKIPSLKKAANRLKSTVLNLMGAEKRVKYQDLTYDIKYEFLKFEKCIVELLPLDDVGFPVYAMPRTDEHRLEYLWHRTRPAYTALRQKELTGFFINTKNVSDYIDKWLAANPPIQKGRQEAEGTVSPQYVKQNRRCEEIEWYGKVDVPSKGLMDCVVWVERGSKTFLGIMPVMNLSRIGNRLVFVGQLVPRLHRMYGKGIADFVVELQKEMDSIHNQRLDAATMSIIPPGIYRAASATEPEELKLQPALWIPVDDVNDVKYLTMPNNVLVSFQEERMLMELIQNISSIGGYQSGQESSVNRTRATATGTMAIIAQGEQRFQILAKRIQTFLGKVLKAMLEQYQEKMPPRLADRVLGDDGRLLFPKGLSVEDISGTFDIYMQLDATGGSKQMERESSANLYGALLQNPLVQQNPTGLYEITADLLKAAGKVDPQRYIGPKPLTPNASTVDDEIRKIKQGVLPGTTQGQNPQQLLQGLRDFMDTEEFDGLEPEKQALVKIRLLNLGTEFAKFIGEMSKQNQQGGVPQGMPQQGGVPNEGGPGAPGGQGEPVLANAMPQAQGPAGPQGAGIGIGGPQQG